MRTIGLSAPRCDVSGCRARPEITDGEFVQCRGHEPQAYQTSMHWLPITRIEERHGDTFPFFVAHY